MYWHLKMQVSVIVPLVMGFFASMLFCDSLGAATKLDQIQQQSNFNIISTSDKNSKIRRIKLAAVSHNNSKALESKTGISSNSNFGELNDPLEPFNKFMFEFNEILNAVVVSPISIVYTNFLPNFIRKGIRNFLNNLRAPAVLANDILQGETERAWDTTRRFSINTTIGLGGLMDVAKTWGIEGHKEDLGQTLAVWGVPEGFYLFLPVLGPSNPRDAIGKLVGGYFDPVSRWLHNTDREEWIYARLTADYVDQYSSVIDELDRLKQTSVHYYAAVKSIYRQKRRAQINNGVVSGAMLPNINYRF